MAQNSVNNFDLSITNNNFFPPLPDYLAALLQQAQAHAQAQLRLSLMGSKSGKPKLGKRKRSLDEDISSEDPTAKKRKHVSSISKAMLAKQILTKIEQENNPTENVNKSSQVTSNEQSHNSHVSDPSANSAEQQASEPQAAPPKKMCNCKRSKCLKLYCECFANNKYCGIDCLCTGCSNDSDHEDERLLAKEQILMRNPLAFRPKVEVQLDQDSLFSKDIKIQDINLQQNSDILLNVSTKPKNFGVLAVQDSEKRHFKGCNCKKSNCQKKYCECYQQGVMCSDLCKCETCKNTEESRPSTYENLFIVQKAPKIDNRVPFGENSSVLNKVNTSFGNNINNDSEKRRCNHNHRENC